MEPLGHKVFAGGTLKQAIAKRGAHLSGLWIFQSPKNGRRFTLQGDLAYAFAVLAEGDLDIIRYEAEPPSVYASIDGEVRQTKLDAFVTRRNNAIEWREYKWSSDATPARTGRSGPQLSAQAQAAQAAGVAYRVITEKDFRQKEILFDNWQFLCAAINRVAGFTASKEIEIFERKFQTHGKLSLGDLLKIDNTDPALILALVAKSLQIGQLRCDLERALLTRSTVLERCQS